MNVCNILQLIYTNHVFKKQNYSSNFTVKILQQKKSTATKKNYNFSSMVKNLKLQPYQSGIVMAVSEWRQIKHVLWGQDLYI